MKEWRLTNQEEYLMSIKWKYIKYIPGSDISDHEHCEFCWETFSKYDGDLHEGYNSEDEQYWVCEKCFNDFKERFHWEIID